VQPNLLVRRTFLFGALLLPALSACGSKTTAPTGPTQPTGPIAAAPQIQCGSAISATITGASKAVSFTAPTVTGGTEPVAVACTPASGSAFPLGTTAVSCAATDASSRQASCSFNVVLSGVQFPVKKFQTVGDSLTAGENGTPQSRPAFVDGPNSYPTKLQALFDAMFPGQSISVANRGVSGRTSAQILLDMPGYLQADHPEAVLLLAGYNDLTGPCAPGFTNVLACDDAVDALDLNLRDCIRRAKEFSGVHYVFVSLLTPTRSGSHAIDNNVIVDVNDNHIRVQASAEGAVLVDNYSNFIGHELQYISNDGLHLQPPGYQAIADAFFARILSTIPTTPPGLSALFRR
jgi:lysophospholipase L1-like esterase